MIKFGQKLLSSDERNYFITSDLHFYHNNIIKFCPATRPWKTAEEMNKGLIDHWNSIVDTNDVVFDVGDMFFCNKENITEILGQLNGDIVHIYGNHSKVLRNQFCGINAFDYLELTYNSTHIILNHYAQRVWNRAHYGSIHCFGHSHGSLEGVGRSMDVGWDAHGRILSLNEVVETLNSKEIYCEDEH